MKTLSSLSLLASTLLAGCLCGGFTGGSDKVYQRGNDMLVVCENYGYSGTLGAATLEGRVQGVGLVDGATGAKASDITYVNGNAVAFGDTWTPVALDQYGLDHADVMCTDLESRTWWLSSSAMLPKETLFGKAPDAFASTEECIAAQEAGQWPAQASCMDQLAVCPDGTFALAEGDAIMTGTYYDDAATLTLSPSSFEMFSATGLFKADGTLATTSFHDNSKQVVWSTAGVVADAYSPHCSK